MFFLEKAMATHSSVLAWRIPGTGKAWWAAIYRIAQSRIRLKRLSSSSSSSLLPNKLWKIPKKMGIPDHLTCLLRNLYAGQEATVRTRHGTTDWFQIGKGVCPGCILSRLFNLYAEHIVRNARLEEAQAGIKIVTRNINNLRYAGGTTLMVRN